MGFKKTFSAKSLKLRRHRQPPPLPLTSQASLKHWGVSPVEGDSNIRREAVVDCGWGRLIFGQTFESSAKLAAVLAKEGPGRRDVAFYVREPHVVVSLAPQSLFLDPSNSFRLFLDTGRNEELPFEEGRELSASDSVVVVRPATADDTEDINRIYAARDMVPLDDGYCGGRQPDSVVILVACDSKTDQPLGVVMGVDHVGAMSDPDNGSSLWALAVDPRAERPGVGLSLVMALADYFRDLGRAFMDLSVMHDNSQAIALYEKLGFVQIPVYCVKTKNLINEKLFIAPQPEEKLNIYARIIVDEARRRGIAVEVDDAEAGLFTLILGGRAISCRESLSDLTSAVALSRCDDKALCRRLLDRSGLRVPAQIVIARESDLNEFLATHGRIVVKPARGEQGRGVRVDLSEKREALEAWRDARQFCETVLAEEYVVGTDLRVIVIGGQMVAAATRREAAIVGNGVHTVLELIEKRSRRLAAATDGESAIPLDSETERCVRAAGFSMTDIPPPGTSITVRKTANLHTGGTIHDVTAKVHPAIEQMAVKAAEVLGCPVVGLDLIMPDIEGDEYVVIEANERPGLANHEPQPTAERFIDLLFPETRDPVAGNGEMRRNKQGGVNDQRDH